MRPSAILRFQPMPEDIESAIRGDQQHCAYAQCFRRLFHTDNVYIFKRYVYVGTLDEQGNKIFERYRIKGAARKYIDDFDSGKGIGPGSFSLHPPTPSDTLDAKQAADERRRNRRRKKKIRGTAAIKSAAAHCSKGA